MKGERKRLKMLPMTVRNIVGMSSHVNDVRSCSIYAAIRAIKRHVSNQRFDHILVDEYQDTNRLQSSILHRMRSLNRNLTVVGDDAQSIYSFRAAEVHNILDFPNRISQRDGGHARNQLSFHPACHSSRHDSRGSCDAGGRNSLRWTRPGWRLRSGMQ